MVNCVGKSESDSSGAIVRLTGKQGNSNRGVMEEQLRLALFVLYREQRKIKWKLLSWAILGSYWGYIEENGKEHGNYYNG